MLKYSALVIVELAIDEGSPSRHSISSGFRCIHGCCITFLRLSSFSATSFIDGLLSPHISKHRIASSAISSIISVLSPSLISTSKIWLSLFSFMAYINIIDRLFSWAGTSGSKLNGNLAVSSSNKTTPKLYTSLLSVNRLVCMYSGSRYPQVPCTSVMNCDLSIGARMEAPKSATLALLSLSRRILEDLTSPWRIGVEADE
uniref:Uncharacterized protein n=1 Tax=Triticum urartu TaxID=4572 RepID=A0A8R7UGN7_TRIUA